MTFEKQIEGVPMELVKQGFRLHPSESLWYYWQEYEGIRRPHWQVVKLLNGAKVSRPVAEVAKGFVVYCHAGWGNHLTPTPEMVKVWAFWWYKAASEPQPHVVEVFQCDEALKYVSDRMHERPIAQARGEWLGPVLPPVTP